MAQFGDCGDINHDSISNSSSSSSSTSSTGSSNSETSSTDTDLKNYKGFRIVTFRKDVVTEVHTVPRLEGEQLDELFYTKSDFARFQASEQKRHDKKMMKQIQEMVREAMKDQLEEAHAKGATQEEIDAMMPQTPEEIFAVLGGMPTPTGMVPMAMMKPPPSVHEEHMHVHQPEREDDENLGRKIGCLLGRTDATDNERHCDGEDVDYQKHTEPKSPVSPDEKHYQTEREEEVVHGDMYGLAQEARNVNEVVSPRKDKKGGEEKSGNHADCPDQLEDFSDNDLYSILGVCIEDDTKDIAIEPKKDCTIQHTFDAKCAAESRGKKTNKHLQRPEQLLDFSDNDLYAMIGVPNDNIDSEG